VIVVAWAVAAVAVVVASVAVVRARRLERVAAAVPDLERRLDRTRTRVEESETLGSRLREAIDGAPQGVVLVDADGAVLLQNRAASEIAGSRHGEAIVRDAVDGVLAEVRAGGTGHRVVDLHGPPPRVVEVQARLVGDGAMAVIEDVTEARRLDAVRRDLIANLGHELKTPLGAIGLLAETLLGETDPQVGGRLAERLVAESFRVSRTVDDLLELSRIEAGGEVPHEPVPVRMIVTGAVDRIRPAADLRGITIHADGVPERVTTLGERRQLVSAVANLLDNAVKYSPPGSEVSLRATSDGSRVTIEVEDHGLGIPARAVERIFERFYRVDRARSRDTGGTGLGLSIVRHIAANHGGDVTVRSEEGVGSTFVLDLPAGPGPVAVPDERRTA